MPYMKSVSGGTEATSARPPDEIRRLLENGAFLLDVRTMSDARTGMAPCATNIPLLWLKHRLAVLPNYRTIVTYCGTGERAGKARDILAANGFKAVNGGRYEGILEILGQGQLVGR